MSKEDTNVFFSKDVWKAFILAVLFTALVAGVLSWQYNKLAEKSEGKISSLESTIEKGFAQSALDQFMASRMSGQEAQINLYLTERAMEQKERGQFVSLGDIKNYKVVSSEEIGENHFRFVVESYHGIDPGPMIEVITVVKILDRYYIDSAGLAG